MFVFYAMSQCPLCWWYTSKESVSDSHKLISANNLVLFISIKVIQADEFLHDFVLKIL